MNFWNSCDVLLLLFVCTRTMQGQDFTKEYFTSKVKGIMGSPSDVREGETMRFPYNPGQTYETCRAMCSEEPICFAFTFFEHYHPDRDWEGECVGRTEYTDVTEVDEYGTSGERIEGKLTTEEDSMTTMDPDFTTEEDSVTTMVDTTAQPTSPPTPVGYRIAQKGDFNSSTGQPFTPECTQTYSDEFREKASTMIPVVNNMIGTSQICPGKSLDEVRVVSASTSFLADGEQGVSSLSWGLAVGGSQQIGSVENCAAEVAAFLADHDNWVLPLLPDVEGCPGVRYSDGEFETTSTAWACVDLNTINLSSSDERYTDQLQYRLLLSGRLFTESGESIIEECLFGYLESFEASTAAKIVQLNEMLGSGLCAGDDIRVGSGSATITAFGNQASSSQVFDLDPAAEMWFDDVYACADEVSAYLQEHSSWDQPIIASPAACPALLFSPPSFEEDSTSWICL